MAVQELFWSVWLVNRKTGERHAIKTIEELTALVSDKQMHGSVLVEATDKVRGFTGNLIDIPDGIYELRFPGFKNPVHNWLLTVTQREEPVYSFSEIV